MRNGRADSEIVDSDQCPVCNKEVFLSLDTKLLRSVCGHTICEPCKLTQFANAKRARKDKVPCPQCGRELLERDFSDVDGKLIKDRLEALVTSERDIRQQVLQVYNHAQADFATLEAYNAHLERIESLVEAYLEGDKRECERIKRELEKTKKDQQDDIAHRAIRKEAARKLEAERLAKEEKEAQLRRNRLREAHRQYQEYAKEVKGSMMNKLAKKRRTVEQARAEAREKLTKKRQKLCDELERKLKPPEAPPVVEIQGVERQIVYTEQSANLRPPPTPVPYSFLGRFEGCEEAEVAGGHSLQHVQERALFSLFSTIKLQ